MREYPSRASLIWKRQSSKDGYRNIYGHDESGGGDGKKRLTIKLAVDCDVAVVRPTSAVRPYFLVSLFFHCCHALDAVALRFERSGGIKFQVFFMIYWKVSIPSNIIIRIKLYFGISANYLNV